MLAFIRLTCMTGRSPGTPGRPLPRVGVRQCVRENFYVNYPIDVFRGCVDKRGFFRQVSEPFDAAVENALGLRPRANGEVSVGIEVTPSDT